MKAWLALRESLHYRRDAFTAGLEACGYSVVLGVTTRPGPKDVLVCWNRYRENAAAADRFEANGRPVLIAENGYLGNDFAGDRWYALARNQHNGAGSFPEGGPERWDALNVPLAPWRPAGGEVVLLPQRGIGPAGVAMPAHWLGSTVDRLRRGKVAFRIREHPGTKTVIPLEQDLAKASAVVTWGSGAALKALAWGIPAFSDMAAWVGAPASLSSCALIDGQYKRSDAARLGMFRRLAWAQWRLSEIASGAAFRALGIGR
jgi:hypothetical protein